MEKETFMEDRKEARKVSFNNLTFTDENGVTHRNSLPLEDIFPGLTRPERKTSDKRIQEWLVKSKAGDNVAKECIIQEYILFVAVVSKRYLGLGLMPEELLEEGKKGLSDAIDTYKPGKYKFIPYAIWFVRHSILDALMKKAHNKV